MTEPTPATHPTMFRTTDFDDSDPAEAAEPGGVTYQVPSVFLEAPLVEKVYRDWAENGTPSELPMIEAWVCDQPSRSATYQVVRDEWIDQGNRLIRLIYEIRLSE